MRVCTGFLFVCGGCYGAEMDWRLGTGGEGESRRFAGSEDRERMAGSFGGASARVRVFNLFYLLAAEIGRRRRVARMVWVGRRWPGDGLRVRLFNFCLCRGRTGGLRRGEWK